MKDYIDIHNLRAIDNARIALGGITVLTGVNGSGKSTITHSLYTLVKNGISLVEEVTSSPALPTRFSHVHYIDSTSPLETVLATIPDTNIRVSPNTNIDSIFDSILCGSIELSTKGELVYSSHDGISIPLYQTGLGMRLPIIFERLYRTGHLNSSTLLIIEEMETHLHPTLIVELTRLIVMLHKILGVTIVLTTYSTDVVSGIKYISIKKDCANGTVFYIAEPLDTHKYTFKALGLDIEPIFKSFNTALDKISQYGDDTSIE